jgi:hypothetical protein
MLRTVQDGAYYEFNRPDGYYEGGREIHMSTAQLDLRFARDVYTLRASDAKSLAKKVSPFPPTWHSAHSAQYFAHYHPGPGEFGQIFYGTRGEYFER